MNTLQLQTVEARLPKINIPTFEGDYMQWQSFFDIYSSTIHERENLTGAQKFQYLRGLLKGEAATLVRHLSITDANYNEAFQKLTNRYDRKRHSVNAFIKNYMDHPSITQPNANNIRKLTDTLDESIRGLKALGTHAEKRDPWLVYIALNKLDNETRALWAQETAEQDFTTIEELFKFLGKRIDMLESVKGYVKKMTPARPIATRSYQTETFTKIHCPICKQGGHRIIECDLYNNMTSANKSESIKKNNRCFNCLNGGHRVTECRSKLRCQQCCRKHHTSLHESSDSAWAANEERRSKANKVENPSSNTNDINKPSTVTANETTSLTINPIVSQGILPTALIQIQDGNGQWQIYRALLDSASQASFISEECMQNLKLRRKNARVLVKGLGEAGVGVTKGATELTISSMDQSTNLKTEVFIIPRVSGVTTEFKLSSEDLCILKDLPLADPNYNKHGSIDVLLGVDIFFKALKSQSVKLCSGLTAVRTIFGWIVAGNHEHSVPNDSPTQTFNVLLDIDKSLRRFWEVEEIPRDIQNSPQEKCEGVFKSSTRKGDDNKFIVKLPFKQPVRMLGTTYNAALNRLKSMEKKFERDKEFESLYKTFMLEYEKLGHMQQVSDSNKINKYFLPHHGVLKTSSTTTKLRVVFDASTKSSTGLSLNDILMVGPTIQPPLINILLRFRQHEFVICGDVKKMYRQVWVDEEDQQCQNILWRTNKHLQPSIYKLKTLTYGTAAASFLAIRSIHDVGKILQHSHPRASQAILKDMYVDDMLTGASSLNNAKEVITEVTNALESLGFKMRKFLTNHSDIRIFIQGTTEKQSKEIGELTDTPRVLGLQWDTDEDNFKFTVQLPHRDKNTKRTLLSDASRSFDPLGWLSPIIIRVKILLQELWMQNIGWDDVLPPNIANQWTEIRADIHETTKIEIPRWLHTKSKVRLIGFSDASEQAYAAVVYAVVDNNNELRPTLIASKSRVAPVKQLSIPRLELMGALLLANLMKLIEQSLTLEVTQIMLFTDSLIVLDWLSAHPRRWTTFVANRVSEIITLYKRECWAHVGSKDNPADIASRGMRTAELVDSQLWWCGPQWLTDEVKIEFIHSKNKPPQNMTTEELRPEKINTLVVSTNSFFLSFVSRYSSYFTMIKVLSLIKRFIRKIKRLPVPVMTNREEIVDAEMSLIREIQTIAFPAELKALKTKGVMPHRSQLTSLNPFIDEGGVIRVGGRIQKSLAPYHVKHPVILPAANHVVKCLVRDTHLFYNHPGVSLLTSIIRRRYWIIRGKLMSREIVHKCIKCIKHSPRAGEQLMGNLPSDRVQYLHPFHSVGVDYCGPFRVQAVRRRGQVPMKVYVCVFVCLSTKAVHVETVCDLTTESFIGALSRFISRRGSCHTIYSDNATNFVGANNYLRELFQFLEAKASDITRAMLRYKIDWKFIPPGAPHMGGVWEAAVKQAKIHLGRVVGETILTLEEFSTLIIKKEAIMNSRPLAVFESEDIDCITPSHFLIGRTFTDIAEEPIQEQHLSPTTRWKIVKKMQQHFWQRWHRDYLTILQKRQKWTVENTNLKVDDVVLIAEKSLPSTCWGLGKVVKTYPGEDNKIRVVDLRVSNSDRIIQRPIHKLCKLPIYSDESADSWPAEC